MPAPAIHSAHQRHIDAARRRLAHLAMLERRTAEADARIRQAAEQRLAQVEADLAKARRRALLHDGAADALLNLTTERARLLHILSQPAAGTDGA